MTVSYSAGINNKLLFCINLLLPDLKDKIGCDSGVKFLVIPEVYCTVNVDVDEDEMFQVLSNLSGVFSEVEDMLLGTTKTKLQFSCDECGRSYSYRRGLTQHQRFECGKLPQFQCPHCPYRSKQKFNLKTHVVLKHSLII
ncbi:hypothetical protein J6590_031393 [Homalodisca vitripennis]|nr:hypothetical protein J6590_014738 [Homalodisca vitripennis]KAG8317261.1 hypothetical protein J6590_031393 [Homalodisca vitripennis]